jgi:small subunit ribosomal protein S13
MPRISGAEIPQEKRIETALTYIYGIGRKLANDILSKAKVDPSKRAKDLTDNEISKLQKIIDTIPTEGVLRKKIQEDIKRLKDIGCYRGIRHLQNLPVRGQRTRSNARTKRGKRVTIGALKKEALTKTEANKITKEQEKV